MTTQITREANPRLPRPDAYTAFLNRLALETENRRKEERRRSVLFALTVALAVIIAGILVLVALGEGWL